MLSFIVNKEILKEETCVMSSLILMKTSYNQSFFIDQDSKFNMFKEHLSLLSHAHCQYYQISPQNHSDRLKNIFLIIVTVQLKYCDIHY